MNLDPHLGKADRIANFALGVGFVAYALLGGFDHVWTRIVILIVGLVTAAGGLRGY